MVPNMTAAEDKCDNTFLGFSEVKLDISCESSASMKWCVENVVCCKF